MRSCDQLRVIRLDSCVAIALSAWQFFQIPPVIAAAATAKYVVGYATFTARIVPLWLAQEQGFFAKYGIDVEPIFIRGAPTLVAGLAASSIHIGRTGGSAMLAAVAAGHDFKVLAAFNTRNTYDLVVRPNIKRAEDLRGKTFGITSIGGTSWMGVLALARTSRPGPAARQHSLSSHRRSGGAGAMRRERPVRRGSAWTACLPGSSNNKGMTVLGEYTDLKSLLIGQSMVVPSAMLQQRPDVAEAYLKGEIEALVFALAPKNKPVVLKTLARWLKVDASGAEDAYSGSRSRRRSQTLRVPRRIAQRPTALESTQPKGRRSQG